MLWSWVAYSCPHFLLLLESEGWESSFFALVTQLELSDKIFFVCSPSLKTPHRFSLRAEAKVLTYRKNSTYFWLQAAPKCALRFLFHKITKHPAFKIITRFFFSGSFAHSEESQTKCSKRKIEVKNTIQNSHNNTFFLILKRQRPWV